MDQKDSFGFIGNETSDIHDTTFQFIMKCEVPVDVMEKLCYTAMDFDIEMKDTTENFCTEKTFEPLDLIITKCDLSADVKEKLCYTGMDFDTEMKDTTMSSWRTLSRWTLTLR